MNTATLVETVLTNVDSAMLILVVGGLFGLGILRLLGLFIKPDYYTRGKSCKP